MRFNNPPDYMEVGSRGPIVNKVLEFLDTWAKGNGVINTGIILDENYGTVGAAFMKEYQRARGISADGGCGPTTRATMLEDCFRYTHLAD